MVVLRHGREGPVDVGLVVRGMGHGRLQIVRHEVFGAAAVELEGPDHAADEVPHGLVGDRPGEEIGACPEDGDEELRLDGLPGGRVLVVGLVAGEVDEHLLSRLVGEPHDRVGFLHPLVVELVEPAPLVAVGVVLPILLVEKLERHALSSSSPWRGSRNRAGVLPAPSLLLGKQELLQLVVAHGGNLRVRDVELLEPVDIGMGG